MKFQLGFLLLALQLGAVTADKRSRHAHLAHKRQNALVASGSSTSSSSAPTLAKTTGASTQATSTGPAITTSTPSSASSVPATATVSGSVPTLSGPPTGISTISVSLSVTPTPAVTGIPQLTQITSGLPSQATDTVTATYTPGASAPISGAPPLPSACK